MISADEKNTVNAVPHQSLLIENGVITKRFPKEALRDEVDLDSLDLIFDAEQKGGVVVTPGLINLHAHPPMYLLRSTLTLAESDLGDALRGMAAIEGRMTDEDYYLGALGDFTEEQKSGITTTLSHYGVFDPIERAAKECNQHVINCVSAASNSHPKNTPAFVESYLKRTDTFTTPGIALHYVWKASPDVLKKIAKLLKKYKTYLTLHVAETKRTVEQCVEVYGLRPIEVLQKYELLGPQTIMSHNVHLTPEEIALIKETGAKVVHLPTSNLLHRSGIFNYKLFRDLDAHHLIGLGTDSVVSKNRLDLLTEALTAKTLHQSSHVLSYEELLLMATAQGADLLGRPDLGRVLPGCRANLVFWKLRDRGLTPYDEDNPLTLVSNMITHGARTVRDLMIDGTFVISNRYHNLVEESALMGRLQEAHMQLRKRAP